MSGTTWIVPGAAVVVITSTPGRAVRPAKRSTIERVNKASFVVDGERYSLKDGRRGGANYSPAYEVVPADSPEATRALAAWRVAVLRTRAEAAVERWRIEPTRDNRLAAIAALEKVED